MYTQPHDVEQKVIAVYRRLAKLYPTTAAYSSKASLFNEGLMHDEVTQEEYDMAKSYYDKLWSYTGD